MITRALWKCTNSIGQRHTEKERRIQKRYVLIFVFPFLFYLIFIKSIFYVWGGKSSPPMWITICAHGTNNTLPRNNDRYIFYSWFEIKTWILECFMQNAKSTIKNNRHNNTSEEDKELFTSKWETNIIQFTIAWLWWSLRLIVIEIWKMHLIVCAARFIFVRWPFVSILVIFFLYLCCLQYTRSKGRRVQQQQKEEQRNCRYI